MNIPMILNVITNTSSGHESAHDSLPDYFHNFNGIVGDLYNSYDNVINNNVFSTRFFEFFLFFLSTLGIIALLILAIKIIRSFKNFRKLKLGSIFWLTFVYGVLVYDIGMYTNDNVSLLTNLPMAILYGFKIFILDSDVSEIHEAFHQSWLYSGNFALVHVLAAVVSTAFVIKHFGFNLISRLNLYRKASFWGRKVSDTYIFWGINENSLELIESIHSHYKGLGSKDYRIVVVRTPNSHEEAEEGEYLTLYKVLNFLSISNPEMDSLLRFKCLTTTCTESVLSTEHSSYTPSDILGKKLNLHQLKKLIEKKTKQTVHLFFLSENTEENLYITNLIQSDTTILKFAESEEKTTDPDKWNCHEVKLYCRSRKNSAHSIIEETNRSENIKIRIIDPSYISVELLKLDEKREIQPVYYVDIEADATVSSGFNSLIVGFGEVGQDALKYLYEFGAFVKSGSTDICVSRSDFHLEAIDKNMKDLAGPFINSSPSLPYSLPFLPE